MSLLSGAAKSVMNKPLIITLFGDAGSGKTSLACEFPDAFLIQTRGEAVPRDVTHTPDQLDACGGKKLENNTWDEKELFDQLMALVREDHEYKTLIVDSATGFEEMFVQNIIDVQPAKQKTMNAAGNGYASEWDTVAAKHGRIRKAAEILRDKKGMNVIFLCHADVVRMEPPDAEPYMKYALQLNKKTSPLYTNQSDVVGFVHQRVYTNEGKAKTSGERVVTVGMTPANTSKNRLGIENDLTYVKGENPFAAYL